MRLADFQNPIANMPLMQQMQQSQNTQAQHTPVILNQTLEEAVNEELTTVQEGKEQEEENQISEEEDRGNPQRKFPGKRAQHSTETRENKKTSIKDGVHGNYLDIQA